MAGAPFRLLTLGRLALLDPSGSEDRTLGTRRRKLAVLAYLALARRPVSRDALVEMFWGDQDEERARHSLSDALSHLRRALGSEAITTRRADIALDPAAPLRVDMVELLAAASAKRFGEVTGLYEGPFLDAVHLRDSPQWEQWVTLQKSTAERHFEMAARAECARLAGVREWPACAALAAQWLHHLPLAQDAAAHLVDALARAEPSPSEGARRALDAFGHWTRRLAAEHELAPEPVLLERVRALETIAAPALPEEPTALPAPAVEPKTNVVVDVAAPPVASPAMVDTRAPAPGKPSRWRQLLGAGAFLLLVAATLALRPTRSDRARARYMQATSAAGNMARAERLATLREALVLDSSFAPAWQLLGTLLRADESAMAEAVAAYANAYEYRDAVKGLERLRIIASYELEVLSDFSAAAATLREVLKLDSTDASTWHELGTIYQRLGDHRRAADAYIRANQLSNQSVGRWMNLVDVLYAAGDTTRALSMVDSLAMAIPGAPTVFRLTSNIASAQGDYANAERQARAYIAAQARDSRGQRIGYELLSRVLWSDGQLDAGDRTAREAIALSLTRGEPEIALLGGIAIAEVSMWRRNDRTRAAQELEDALLATPLDSIAPLQRPLTELASAFALVGDTSRARILLERYEQEFPVEARRYSQSAIAYARGMIAMAQGNAADALSQFEMVATPDCAVCGLPEVGLAHEALGNDDEARARYAEFLSTPTLRRVDLVDALHRDWVTRRLNRRR